MSTSLGMGLPSTAPHRPCSWPPQCCHSGEGQTAPHHSHVTQSLQGARNDQSPFCSILSRERESVIQKPCSQSQAEQAAARNLPNNLTSCSRQLPSALGMLGIPRLGWGPSCPGRVFWGSMSLWIWPVLRLAAQSRAQMCWITERLES
jgi:hypothetical protein